MSDTQSSEEIDKAIAALQEKREAVFTKERIAALKTTIDAVTKFKFTAGELGITAPAMEKKTAASKKVGTSKAEPKYKDPATGKTWAGGKGPKPKFIKDQIKAGKSIDVFLIKK